jgi:hypothetical protein
MPLPVQRAVAKQQQPANWFHLKIMTTTIFLMEGWTIVNHERVLLVHTSQVTVLTVDYSGLWNFDHSHLRRTFHWLSCHFMTPNISIALAVVCTAWCLIHELRILDWILFQLMFSNGTGSFDVLGLQIDNQFIRPEKNCQKTLSWHFGFVTVDSSDVGILWPKPSSLGEPNSRQFCHKWHWSCKDSPSSQFRTLHINVVAALWVGIWTIQN